MNESEFSACAIRQAETDIASALRNLELAVGRTVLGVSIDHTFINTMSGKNRKLRVVNIELSERHGQEWNA